MSKYIIVDSREKPRAISRILDYFDSHGIQYETSKLLFGDYMDYNRPGLVIDRKQNVLELSKNCTADHERFRRELEKVKATGSELIVLVEQNRYKDRDEWVELKSIEDLLRWSSPYTMVRGEKVFRVLSSWCSKYPLRVEFCSKRSTGKRIIELIYGDDRDG